MTLYDVSKVLSGTNCIRIWTNDKIVFNGERSQSWVDLDWNTVQEYFDYKVICIEGDTGNSDSEFSYPVFDIKIKKVLDNLTEL